MVHWENQNHSQWDRPASTTQVGGFHYVPTKQSDETIFFQRNHHGELFEPQFHRAWRFCIQYPKHDLSGTVLYSRPGPVLGFPRLVLSSLFPYPTGYSSFHHLRNGVVYCEPFSWTEPVLGLKIDSNSLGRPKQGSSRSDSSTERWWVSSSCNKHLSHHLWVYNSSTQPGVAVNGSVAGTGHDVLVNTSGSTANRNCTAPGQGRSRTRGKDNCPPGLPVDPLECRLYRLLINKTPI